MTDKPLLSPAERRARKAARREKQREANLGRAEKMHKARMAAVPPPLPDAASLPRINIGCSGWYYWHWGKSFYPDADRKTWFPHYASQFDTVELNAPFYSWPTLATVQSWIRQAGDRPFLYTVKASELITHVRKFEDTADLVQDFDHIADLLGPRMGCFLFQTPPSFHYSQERLAAIVGQLDRNRRNVLEFRHPSWWNEEVYAACREAGIIFCSCSGPRLPGDMIRTADDVYIRFHGIERWYRHDYSDAELQDWADRIKASGATRIWAYFNNDYEANAVRNAQTLRAMLET